MELILSSQQINASKLYKGDLLKDNQSAIPGFNFEFKNFTSFTQLKQNFLSPNFDIYIYQLDIKEPVELFLQSVSCKWLLFYLVSGRIEQLYLNNIKKELFEKSAFFTTIQRSHSLKMTFRKSKQRFICCNLKSSSENILINYYTTLFNKVDEYPIIINSLDLRAQNDWEKLFKPIDLVELLPSKLNSQVQVILSNFCYTYKSRMIFSSQTGTNPIAEKMFQIKKLIDCYPFKRHSLNSISVHINLGTRIIKLNFQQLFKKSVTQYCIEKRMEYAIYLLENHFGDSIKKVAFSCGFKKPQHFIRQFHQKYGQSPGKYRGKFLR